MRQVKRLGPTLVVLGLVVIAFSEVRGALIYPLFFVPVADADRITEEQTRQMFPPDPFCDYAYFFGIILFLLGCLFCGVWLISHQYRRRKQQGSDDKCGDTNQATTGGRYL
jgi:hypothetical protein